MGRLCYWISTVLMIIILLLAAYILSSMSLGKFGENKARPNLGGFKSPNRGYYVGRPMVKVKGGFKDASILS